MKKSFVMIQNLPFPPLQMNLCVFNISHEKFDTHFDQFVQTIS